MIPFSLIEAVRFIYLVALLMMGAVIVRCVFGSYGATSYNVVDHVMAMVVAFLMLKRSQAQNG